MTPMSCNTTFLAIFLGFLTNIGLAQIQLLNDEFDQSQSIINWHNINETEQWNIQQLEHYDINTSMVGHLEMMPYTVSWFEAYRGPLIYKEVTDDFVFTGSIAIMGRSGGVPTSNFQFNLAGVMCRIPVDYPNGPFGANGWQTTDQNYIFLAIGGANDGDNRCDPSPAPCLAPHLEVKTTTNGNSILDIQDIDTTQAEFRFARIGQVFIIMYKLATATDWVIHRRYERNDFPETVQIGFVTYTNWPKVASYTPAFHNSHTLNSSLNPDPSSEPGLVFSPDVIGDFDFARFDSLVVPPEFVGLNFFNPMSVSDEELLSFLDYNSEVFCPTNLHIHSEIDSNAYVQIQAEETITMDTSILTNSTVQVNAGTAIQLLPGFVVAAGSNFTTSIAGCAGNNLVNPIVSKNAKVHKPIVPQKKLTLSTAPNPFLNATTITYALSQDEVVSLKIYDVNGRLVHALLDKVQQNKGNYSYEFYPEKKLGAIFYVLLTTTQEVQSQSLILLKND